MTSLQQRSVGDLDLCLGGRLENTVLSYRTYGHLAPDASNAILVTHGLTSGPDMLEARGGSEGSWAQLLAPGRALDTSRYFVICSNVIGSSFGSTSPASLRAGTGAPWGVDFPELTLSDMVAAQRRLLTTLGIEQLHAVIGPSYGGMQALQWAIDTPEAVKAIAVVVSDLSWPTALSSQQLRQHFAKAPGWSDVAYVPGNAMRESLYQLRLETLRSYGFEDVAQQFPLPGSALTPPERLAQAAQSWAEHFDPQSLLTLQRAGERFDVRDTLARIRCPVLFAPCHSDQVFPPQPSSHALLQAALGGRLRWREIHSPYGHLASGIEIDQWEPDLQQLLAMTA